MFSDDFLNVRFDLFHGFAGQNTAVDVGGGFRRQNVWGVAALNHRRSKGRAQNGVCDRNHRENRFDEPAQKIAVYHEELEREFHVRSKNLEGFFGNRRPFCGHRVLFEIADCLAEQIEVGRSCGVRSVAARFFAGEGVVAVTFFAGADHADEAVDAQQTAVKNRAAFVDDEFQFDVLRFEPFDDLRRAFAACHRFFVVAEADVNVSFRRPTGGEKVFHTFDGGDKLTFHIRGAAAVDVTVVNFAAERRIIPTFGRSRNHVLMSKKRARFQIRVFALDVIDDGKTVYYRSFRNAVYVRIGLFEKSPEIVKRLCVFGVFANHGHGRDLHGLLKVRSQNVFVKTVVVAVRRGESRFFGEYRS